jgi:hypothetical protein
MTDKQPKEVLVEPSDLFLDYERLVLEEGKDCDIKVGRNYAFIIVPKETKEIKDFSKNLVVLGRDIVYTKDSIKTYGKIPDSKETGSIITLQYILQNLVKSKPNLVGQIQQMFNDRSSKDPIKETVSSKELSEESTITKIKEMIQDKMKPINNSSNELSLKEKMSELSKYEPVDNDPLYQKVMKLIAEKRNQNSAYIDKNTKQVQNNIAAAGINDELLVLEYIDQNLVVNNRMKLIRRDEDFFIYIDFNDAPRELYNAIYLVYGTIVTCFKYYKARHAEVEKKINERRYEEIGAVIVTNMYETKDVFPYISKCGRRILNVLNSDGELVKSHYVYRGIDNNIYIHDLQDLRQLRIIRNGSHREPYTNKFKYPTLNYSALTSIQKEPLQNAIPVIKSCDCLYMKTKENERLYANLIPFPQRPFYFLANTGVRVVIDKDYSHAVGFDGECTPLEILRVSVKKYDKSTLFMSVPCIVSKTLI